MKISSVIFTIFLVTSAVYAGDGMLNVESKFSVENTADRMERVLNEKGMTIFNRINHSESAGNIGIQLGETQLKIFGNPKAGSPLMKCQQSIAIDLPQKALIWKDENNKVWISYNDPRYLQKRHKMSGCEKAISKIEKALANITKSAADKE
ncbi:MAG: DUF302 domain-containing protein [Desulfobacter sp.]|nr:DUF302 domain-containing protein [Desulfobacter sp.]WDP83786.1 MAG: DUF302 domain-containing protein [Desulfobacter sp.]